MQAWKLCAFTLRFKYHQVDIKSHLSTPLPIMVRVGHWPEPYIYGAFTVFLARNSPYIQNIIYGSGIYGIHRVVQFVFLGARV